MLPQRSIFFGYNTLELTVTTWYCKCAGACVVWVCSHIASVVWDLGFPRHSDGSASSIQNWGNFVRNAVFIDISNTDDSEVEV
jgi:hypothetical protein